MNAARRVDVLTAQELHFDGPAYMLHSNGDPPVTNTPLPVILLFCLLSITASAGTAKEEVAEIE